MAAHPDLERLFRTPIPGKYSPADTPHRCKSAKFGKPSVETPKASRESFCESTVIFWAGSTEGLKIVFVHPHAVPLEGEATGKFGERKRGVFRIFFIVLDF